MGISVMISPVKSPLRTQSGLTLISLMIGLVISMITIVASLVVYRNLVHVSADNKIYSGMDGRISVATLVLEKSVQSAGFGMNDAAMGDDITIHRSGTDLRLLWRQVNPESGVVSCEGFEESTNSDASGVAYRELKMITAQSGCNDSSSLESMTWNAGALLARWRMMDDKITEYINDNSSLFAFSISEGECSMFGRTLSEEPENHLILTITAPDAAYLFSSSVPVTPVDVCLYNFHPDAS